MTVWRGTTVAAVSEVIQLTSLVLLVPCENINEKW